jgi:hypothetical protein
MGFWKVNMFREQTASRFLQNARFEVLTAVLLHTAWCWWLNSSQCFNIKLLQSSEM